MSAVRNFILTMLISLLIFGFLAYGIMVFASDAFSLGAAKPSDNNEDNAETSKPDDQKPPEDFVSIKGESFTALFIGTDYRPDVYDDYEYTDKEIDGFPAPLREIETDTIILVRVNKESGECIFCSIPTNAEILIDGLPSTLNKLYARQGIGALVQQVTILTGLPIDYYGITTIGSLAYIIDQFGGIEFYVPEDIEYIDEGTNQSINIPKGSRLLDGKTAADMLRYNSYKDGDVTRRRVNVDFLKALISKAMSETAMKDAVSAYIKYSSKIETNLTIKDLTDNAELIFSYSKMTVKEYTYPGKTTGTDKDAKFVASVEEALKFFNKYKFKG